ncbi:hypothetical protein DCS_06299 [Drechmeria coniospora]|uniref:Chitin synthesis regulation, Congo red resistance, RCR protein n=1 Tax=Drechmeria coniospora TaxID=98403 RepID=A0A151GB56_DRECN|nr:hypothetical protein DCS_06299 [Drechmeria coniospora]KYK54342.1 hypothetical protein DCS_06299 [Drechmeria coniospora]ODA77370.1 hypothetical protein RJ55_06998 [Drechmeria coniospora]
MAPTITELAKRYYYNCGYNSVCYSNRWYDWGRWVVVGVVIFVIFLVFLTCSCIARRRRRRGTQPIYGTGWMAGGKPSGQDGQPMNGYQSGYNPQAYGQPGQNAGFAPPPPAYGNQQHPQYTGTTFNPNDGYYGQQQYGVQQPASAYQPETTYAPPTGPPPGK